jgi:hypothetical protein
MPPSRRRYSHRADGATLAPRHRGGKPIDLFLQTREISTDGTTMIGGLA